MTERLRQGLDNSKAVSKFKGMRRRRQIGIPAFAVILALLMIFSGSIYKRSAAMATS